MTTNLIPMAGQGSRFTNEGFTLPKALVPVSGIPMVIRAIRNMPKADKWIFVVRQEHINNYQIDKLIKNEIPSAIIISVNKTTEGQACTCMLAEQYLDENEPLFIAACDNGYLYSESKYVDLCKDDDIHSIIWTFTKREILRKNPFAFGWCQLENGSNIIKDVSVKTPISDDPYNDHAVVASFFFKKAKYFISAVNLMINENYRINNEFYVDALPIFLKKMGKQTVIFDVDFYLVWGTPKDLYDYQEMEYFCRYNISPPSFSEEKKRLLPIWKEYFDRNKII